MPGRANSWHFKLALSAALLALLCRECCIFVYSTDAEPLEFTEFIRVLPVPGCARPQKYVCYRCVHCGAPRGMANRMHVRAPGARRSL